MAFAASAFVAATSGAEFESEFEYSQSFVNASYFSRVKPALAAASEGINVSSTSLAAERADSTAFSSSGDSTFSPTAGGFGLGSFVAGSSVGVSPGLMSNGSSTGGISAG